MNCSIVVVLEGDDGGKYTAGRVDMMCCLNLPTKN